MNDSYDVLISGAGPVGATLGLALHAQGRRVCLTDLAAQPPCDDDRSLGLTTGTVRFLQQLGVWSRVTGAEQIRSLHISERGRFGRSHIHARDHGLEALGAVVPAQSLHDALEAALAAAALPVRRNTRLLEMPLQLAGAKTATTVENASPVCYAESTPASVSEAVSHRRCTLRADNGEELTVAARLVVGADGAQSSVRELLQIGVNSEDYGQLAIVSQMNTGRDVQGCAYERFSADGPMAVMPRGRRRVGIIWMPDAQRAQALLDAPEHEFEARFQTEFGWRLGKLTLAAPRLRWPLKRMRAARLTGPRALLMGNAAGAFHPIAAQSFNLAMRDAQALCIALQTQADPGDAAMLARLEASRRRDHDAIEGMTDGLVKIFTQRLPALAQLRSLGLLGVELAGPLQGRLVGRSAGTEEVPV